MFQEETFSVGVLDVLKKHYFNDHASLSVKFAGEPAMDEGGPSRELMTLLLKEISKAPIFVGPENQRCLTVNVLGKSGSCYFEFR